MNNSEDDEKKSTHSHRKSSSRSIHKSESNGDVVGTKRKRGRPPSSSSSSSSNKKKTKLSETHVSDAENQLQETNLEPQKNDTIEKKQLSQEKNERERREQEQREREEFEKERREREDLEKERREREDLEKEQRARERFEKEKFERERLERESLESKKIEYDSRNSLQLDTTIGNKPYTVGRCINLIESKELISDDVMDTIAKHIFNVKEKTLFLSSLNLQVVLSKLHRNDYPSNAEKRKDKIWKDLDMFDRIKHSVNDCESVIAVIHGPHTESTLQNVYSSELDRNSHWSLFAWFKSKGKAYHYDSMSPVNSKRCEEVFVMLRDYGILPEKLNDFWVPHFMSQQRDGWECGYYVLLILKLILDKTQYGVAHPLSRVDVTTLYREWFDSITSVNGKFFTFLLNSLQNAHSTTTSPYDNIDKH